MIVPNCRQRITGRDLSYALAVLAQDAAPADEAPGALLAEDVDIDRLLESRELFEALIGSPALLSVSPWLFYYVLVRHVFRERGIDDRTIADYVGALLAHFQEGKRLRNDGDAAPRSFVYLVDMIESVGRARSRGAAFALEARIGDVALFLTGIFPDAIVHRQTYGRRAPGLEYYESMGRLGYHSASRHTPAQHAELSDVLSFMASEFRVVRKALNVLSDTYLCLSRRESIDRLLRQALDASGTEGEDPGRAGGADG
jgi:hypothetical protein